MKHPKRLIAGVAALTVASAAGVAAVWDRQSETAAGAIAVAVGKQTTSAAAGQLSDEQKKLRKAEVDVVLAARAAAVLKGDLKRFVATVDPGQPKVVARQKLLFTNLRKFGFGKLTYVAADERQSPEMTRRFGAESYTTRVMMRYQLTGLDPRPVQTDLGYTFVKRGGSWLIVDDNGIDSELSRDGHRQPWDYQEVAVVRRGKVAVVVDQRELALGQKIAKTSQSAVDGVKRHWAGGWDGSVMVVAMPEARVLSLLWVSGNGRGWSIAASAVPTYAGDPVNPGPTAPVSTRIVINPEVRKTLDRYLLAHEMTHAATQRLGRQGPLWMVEGLAEYIRCAVVEDDPSWTVNPYRREVRKTLSSMKALPERAEFDANGDRSYGQAWWTVGYLVSELGEKKVAAFYADLARNGWTDTIVKKHTKMTSAQLLAAVKRFRG